MRAGNALDWSFEVQLSQIVEHLDTGVDFRQHARVRGDDANASNVCLSCYVYVESWVLSVGNKEDKNDGQHKP